MKRWLPPFLLLLAIVSPLVAGGPPTRSQVLLTESPSRESLRASLLDHARGVATVEPASAGEAFFYAGLSYDRAGHADSAIACYRSAIALRGGIEERVALADALLRRRAEGDLEHTRALLDSSYVQAANSDDPDAAAYQARLAWVDVLEGNPSRALQRFAPLEATLSRRALWRYRIAHACFESGDPRRALAVAWPLAVWSRSNDQAAEALLERANEALGGKGRLAEQIERAIAAHDAAERRPIARLGGRRVRFAAADGFSLGGVTFAPAGAGQHRAVVVLCEPGDTLASYDTLAVALARSGRAVMLMELRGSGWSSGPACPLPEAWVGREDALQSSCARDVREALRALSLVTPVDTLGYVVAGVGRTASIAVEAATLDRRVQALLLLSPNPSPVDRGLTRARIAALQRPIFFSNAPEDYPMFELTDALYQAGNRSRSRVADARAPGHGAQPLRGDPTAAPRLIRWLDDQAQRRGRPAPPPSGPRRG